MDASSSRQPEILPFQKSEIHCHTCCVLMLRERDKQLENGRTIMEVMISPPNLAYTFEPQMSLGMIVSVPVCLMHMAYKEESILKV